MKFNFKADSGQIGVIILLTMTGMLVMGLSAASRTTQEALLSGKESESVRVFNAAEQGVEEALSGDLAFVGNSLEGSIDTVSGINIDYSVNKVSSLQTRIFEGISVGVDVTGVQDGDNLRIDWSNVSDCDTENVASLVASIYYDDAGVTRARYSALGGCDKSDGFDL